MLKSSQRRCQLAWHVTLRCNLHCRHCIRHGQISGPELSLDDGHQMLLSFLEFTERRKRPAVLSLTGGNPWEHESFLDILGIVGPLRKSGRIQRIYISGNPEAINDETILAMREAGVDGLRFSLDGLESTNDMIRGKGCFQNTINALGKLRGQGFNISVKITILRCNVGELNSVYKLAIEAGADSVGFQQLITAGGGDDMRDEMISPNEYRQFLLSLLENYDSSTKYDRRQWLHVIRRQPLYARLFHELGRWDEYLSIRESADRAHWRDIGLVFFVWPDGEVVMRRDMTRLGYVPQSSFEQLYESSKPLRNLDDPSFAWPYMLAQQRAFAKCRHCPTAHFCPPRLIGAYNSELNYAPNSTCWVS